VHAAHLEALNLSGCGRLQDTQRPSCVVVAPALTRLVLAQCHELTTVDKGTFPRLLELNLHGCREIKDTGPLPFPYLANLVITILPNVCRRHTAAKLQSECRRFESQSYTLLNCSCGLCEYLGRNQGRFKLGEKIDFTHKETPPAPLISFPLTRLLVRSAKCGCRWTAKIFNPFLTDPFSSDILS
jgi:hypothetical protein